MKMVHNFVSKRVTKDYLDYKSFISDANQTITELSQNLVNLPHQPFGSNLACSDFTTCADSLVIDRIASKFHIPDHTRSSELRKQAFESYLVYESTTLADVDKTFNIWEGGRVGYILRHARSFLAGSLKGFSVDLTDCDVEFTGGESYISSKGEVSLLAKLADLDHWTTTWNCLEDTCVLIYNNLSLRRLARFHIGHLSSKVRRDLYDTYRGPNIGYRVFRHLLIHNVLTIVDGARGTTVPKNNDKDRFINVEATFPMVLQRLVAAQLRAFLERMGNHLDTQIFKGHHCFDAQEVHKLMISDSRFSTIDFSNASDSVLLKVVCELLPPAVCDLLLRYRSAFVEIDGSNCEPLKLSSMGNGFTFEVMTVILFAIGYQLSDTTRVYGDDVIITHDSVEDFTKVCRYIGFTTNEKKTFVRSRFRESCGAFYHDDAGYITSFAFGPLESFQDVIISHNKLRLIIEADQVSYGVKCVLLDAADELLRKCPASRKGPLPSDDADKVTNLGAYFYDVRWLRKHMKSELCSINHSSALKRYSRVLQNYSRDKAKFAIVFVPVYVPHKSHKVRFDKAVYAAFLYAGRNAKALVRGRGKWVDKPAVVFDDGSIFYCQELSRLNREQLTLDKAITLRDGIYTNVQGAAAKYRKLLRSRR